VSGETGISAFGQRLGFQLVWLACSSWLDLSAGRTTYVLPPSGADAAVHQAAIIRLPPSVASQVASILERLRERDPHHHYYPPKTMHVTIRKLGAFLPDDPGRLVELRNIVASYPSFELTMRGLSLSPTTVFAQIMPHGQTFRSLSRHLGIMDRNVYRSSSHRVREAVARTLAHVNVIRFSGPVTAGFVKEVSRFRGQHFGRWTVREVEFVRSDKLLSREGTQVLERTPLAMF
jgi:2'-5' RNA ligase